MLRPRTQLKNPFERPARLRGLALLALVLSVLAILGGMIFRNLDRMDKVQAYVSYSHRIQDVGLSLQKALVDVLSGHTLVPEQLALIASKIHTLVQEDAHLSPQTPGRLGAVTEHLKQSRTNTKDNGRTELFEALQEMHEILDNETDQRERVLEEISREELTELELATLIITLILLLTWLFLHQRILHPLQDLKQLLLNLAEEKFHPIETDHLDPLLLPIFNSYNFMVRHLEELEEAKRMHAKSLEAEVRTATEALLEQQRSLARAEKLAAVGELAASLAHELRNPLAGIQMSCANLREEIQDVDQQERLDLIGSELKRITRLLNELLDQGKHTPAPFIKFNLAQMVRELCALTRYQIPAHIELTTEVPEQITCNLPVGELRQVLLNLILNAAQAMDTSAGIVTIRATQQTNLLLLEVNDQGPGFNSEIMAQGIRPFATTRLTGTGLGLTMVQNFVRGLGGQIELTNNENSRGACVRIALPCEKK